MPWLATRRSVNISRAAVKLPGAMVWGHGSSSAPEWHGFSRIDEVSSDHFQRQRMWWVSFQETHLLFDCDTATGAIVSLHLLEKPMLQKWEKAVKSWLGSGHGSKLLSHLTSLYPNQSRTIPPAPLQRRRTWLGDYKYVQPNWHASAAVKLLSSCASGVWGEIAHRYCKSDACTKNQAADLRVPTLQYIILNYILPAHARPMVSASIPKTTPGELRQGWTVAHPRKTKHLYHWASVIQISKSWTFALHEATFGFMQGERSRTRPWRKHLSSLHGCAWPPVTSLDAQGPEIDDGCNWPPAGGRNNFTNFTPGNLAGPLYLILRLRNQEPDPARFPLDRISSSARTHILTFAWLSSHFGSLITENEPEMKYLKWSIEMHWINCRRRQWNW